MNSKFVNACDIKEEKSDSYNKEMGLDGIFNKSMGIKSKSSADSSKESSKTSTGSKEKRGISVVSEKGGSFIELSSAPVKPLKTVSEGDESKSPNKITVEAPA